MDNIKILKLISGEFIIAYVEPGNFINCVKVKDPLLIRLQHSGKMDDPRVGIGFAPFNIFAKQGFSFDLKKDHIIFETDDFEEEVKKNYFQVTSGIHVAKSL